MRFGSTVAKSSRAKECCVARLVAIRLSLVLRMAARRKSFAAFLTFQARSVPIFSEGTHLLGEIYFLVAFRTLGHGEFASRTVE